MGGSRLEHTIHMAAITPNRAQTLAEIQKWDMPTAGNDLADSIGLRRVKCEVVQAGTQVRLNIVKLPQNAQYMLVASVSRER